MSQESGFRLQSNPEWHTPRSASYFETSPQMVLTRGGRGMGGGGEEKSSVVGAQDQQGRGMKEDESQGRGNLADLDVCTGGF